MTEAQDSSRALPAVRVADAEREVAARQLQLAVQQGQLGLAELDDRLAAVYSARTPAELVALVADLPPAAGGEPLELRTGNGSREKSGEWVVPAEIAVECTSGSIRLDFTEALCPHAEVRVHLTAGSGSVTLVVPHGWRVDLDRVQLGSGAIRNEVTGPSLPGYPLLRVQGRVRSGSVRAGYPKPPRRGFWAWVLRRPRPA